jgi:hypothetical protein
MVGEAGLEPAISCSQSTCVTRLRYSPPTTVANGIIGVRGAIGRRASHGQLIVAVRSVTPKPASTFCRTIRQFPAVTGID